MYIYGQINMQNILTKHELRVNIQVLEMVYYCLASSPL